MVVSVDIPTINRLLGKFVAPGFDVDKSSATLSGFFFAGNIFGGSFEKDALINPLLGQALANATGGGEVFY